MRCMNFTMNYICQTPSSGKCVFTLIELLVVIAIIAILAALLLPTLKNAQDIGRSATCASNLKQVSSAVWLYADDYNCYAPTQNEHYYKGYWMGQLGSYLGYAGNLSACYGAGGSTYFADKYIKVLQCPVRWNKKPWSGGNAYGMSSHLTMLTDPALPVLNLIQATKYASTTFMAGDTKCYNTIYPEWLAQTCDPTHTFYGNTHSGGLNMLFCDGHVTLQKYGITTAAWEYPSSGIVFRPGWRNAPE